MTDIEGYKKAAKAYLEAQLEHESAARACEMAAIVCEEVVKGEVEDADIEREDAEEAMRLAAETRTDAESAAKAIKK